MKTKIKVTNIIHNLNKSFFGSYNVTNIQKKLSSLPNKTALLKKEILQNKQLANPEKADLLFEAFLQKGKNALLYKAAELSDKYIDAATFVKESFAPKEQYIAVESKTHGWFSDDIKVNFQDTIEIGKWGGKTLYAHLSEDFSDIRVWQNALEKGFAKRKFGEPGVKPCGPKSGGINLFELKTKNRELGDKKLYTTKIYDNGTDGYLVEFFKQADHKTIERIIRKTSFLETIQCDSTLPTDDNDVSEMGCDNSTDINFES